MVNIVALLREFPHDENDKEAGKWIMEYAADEIERLTEQMKQERSAYMLAHGVFQSESLRFSQIIELCIKSAESWATCDMTMATQVAAKHIADDIRNFAAEAYPQRRDQPL